MVKKTTETVKLSNGTQELIIYRVEDCDDEYCIGVVGTDDHFDFTAEDAPEIIEAIKEVCGIGE